MRPARSPPQRLELLATPGFADYGLLDSGGGRKLERFGAIVVDRPEPQALWSRQRSPAEWAQAHAVFSGQGEDDEKGRWRVDKPVPESWPICISAEAARATVLCRLSALWHLGLFPEQQPHWSWMVREIAAERAHRARVLNLFGYTGAASLLAAAAGAEVTHLDASKKAVQWGRENQAASGLADAPIRWIVDDARKFAAREVRRGRQYDVILIDPPKFGRGPEGEVWDLFADLPALLADCVKLLAPERAAMVLTVYAIRASAIAFDQVMREHIGARGGSFEMGELAILEEGGGRLVPTSLYTRWTA
jgi:23S rRNA (cytosine1962-C5)-methyltransferase